MEPAVGQSKHDLTGCGYCAPVQTGQGGNRKSRYDYAFGGDKNAALFASGKNRVVMGRREPFRGTDGFLRNRRDVWLIPGKPFKGAHFAVFPEKLIEPCILAGTSGGGSCFRCGFPRFEKQVSLWWQKGLVAGYGDGSEDAIEEFFEAVEGDYEFLKDKKDSEIGGNLPRVRSSIMSFMTTVKANEKLEKGG
jgi:hypothetical protein